MKTCLKASTFSLIIVLAGVFTNPSHAQTAKVEAVKQTIELLFDGMRASDSTMVAEAFSEDAVMNTVTRDSLGQTRVQAGSLPQFLIAVGTPKDRVWDEKILNYQINIDGDLATAWTPYEFWLGDDFSHCGVNAMQLVHMQGAWKIINIIDTRRREDCRN